MSEADPYRRAWPSRRIEKARRGDLKSAPRPPTSVLIPARTTVVRLSGTPCLRAPGSVQPPTGRLPVGDGRNAPQKAFLLRALPGEAQRPFLTPRLHGGVLKFSGASRQVIEMEGKKEIVELRTATASGLRGRCRPRARPTIRPGPSHRLVLLRLRRGFGQHHHPRRREASAYAGASGWRNSDRPVDPGPTGRYA